MATPSDTGLEPENTRTDDLNMVRSYMRPDETPVPGESEESSPVQKFVLTNYEQELEIF